MLVLVVIDYYYFIFLLGVGPVRPARPTDDTAGKPRTSIPARQTSRVPACPEIILTCVQLEKTKKKKL